MVGKIFEDLVILKYPRNSNNVEEGAFVFWKVLLPSVSFIDIVEHERVWVNCTSVIKDVNVLLSVPVDNSLLLRSEVGDRGKEGDHDDDEHDRKEVLLGIRHLLPQEVPKKGHAPYP